MPSRNSLRTLIGAAIFGSALSLSATFAASQELELISGGMDVNGSYAAEAALKFAELVSEKSDGRITISHYPGGQLGNGQEQMEGVSIGTQQFFISSGSQASRLLKSFAVIDSAFLFKDFDHFTRFMESEMGQELDQRLADEFGVRIVSANWFGLPRWLMHRSKFIMSVEDVAGVRTRAPSIAIYIQNYENMGAVPVKIDLAEQYLALSQGIVEMTESAAHRILNSKLYEVAPYITEADMMFPQDSVYVNKEFWDGLSEADQQLIKEAADEAGDIYTKWARDAFETERQDIIDNGGQFQRMPEEVRAEFARMTADNLDKMVADGLIPEGWYEKIIALRDVE